MKSSNAVKKKSSAPKTESGPYSTFSKINGTHPYKQAVPDGFVDYAVRKREGGHVIYFNFELAKEIGLIPKNHPHKLTKSLEKAILDTFAITIINEYDLLHGTPIDKKDVKPHKYMATRYLQLQHSNKRGTTSGDGRSIWNGCFKNAKGVTWDFSSCGTGATRLSPATAAEKRFFKTGDKVVAYGCGFADLDEGIGAAILSEIFHKNGILTERVLANIEFEKGVAVNVRASKNLLRPSHFFMHLKQENYKSLKASIDFFIDRQIANGTWPKIPGSKRYVHMAEQMALTFSEICAKFETDYIFCWLDWDGDNILANGGIIDYGSVRQFGLYHHEYRYDDVDRYSTTIPEQKNKAKQMVQTFAQIRDYLITGRKKSLEKYANDPILKLFDRNLDDVKRANVLYKIGFTLKQRLLLEKKAKKDVDRFIEEYSHFEKATSSKGKYETGDGITVDAIFCLRDILRALPTHFQKSEELLSHDEFIEIIKSNYAEEADLKATAKRRKHVKNFQELYLKLVHLVAGKETTKLLKQLETRATVINKRERITGDAVIEVTDKIIQAQRKMSFEKAQKTIEDFIEEQVLRPEVKKEASRQAKKSNKVLEKMIQLVDENKEGI